MRYLSEYYPFKLLSMDVLRTMRKDLETVRLRRGDRLDIDGGLDGLFLILRGELVVATTTDFQLGDSYGQLAGKIITKNCKVKK